MIQKTHITFRTMLLTAALSVSTLFLPGCYASGTLSSEGTAGSESESAVKMLSFEKLTPASIAAAMKNDDTAEKLLANFGWFYNGYMKKGLPLDYVPKGAVQLTDPSDLDGEWQVTHFRHPEGEWQKQLLSASLKTSGTSITYTEEWEYIFYSDGKLEDASGAAHDLPYSGTAKTGPLSISLTEELYDNKLDYVNFFEYDGYIYALGTYFSAFDGDLGYAAMYKKSDHASVTPTPAPTPSETPKTEPVQTQQPTGKPVSGVNETPETVEAPGGLEYLEGTWKGGKDYFTIRFLGDGRLNYIQYSIDALGSDTGFGGLDAHYYTYSYCDYTVDSSGNSVSFKNGTSGNVVIERTSDGLRIRSDKNGESTVKQADAPTVFVPKK